MLTTTARKKQTTISSVSYLTSVIDHQSDNPQRLLQLALLMCGLITIALTSVRAQTISYSVAPAYGSNDDLHGTVTDAVPADHRVIVCVFIPGSNLWWTKPSEASMLIPIQPDGSWTADITTHPSDLLAVRIAAFLIPTSYTPPPVLGVSRIPEEIITNALDSFEIYHTGLALTFGGYDWDIKDSDNNLFGPGPNYFGGDAENAWVDGNGKLHLKITEDAGQWTCAEVILRESLGYGTYKFCIETPVENFDANVVLGLFTWEVNSDHPAYREIDIEIAKWGNPSDPTNAQFVVQPYTTSGNLTRITIPSATDTIHSFEWSPNQVHFESTTGLLAPIADWTFTGSDVPEPAFEQTRINLWLLNGSAPQNGQEFEVVISDFQFTPRPLPVSSIELFSMVPNDSVQLQITGEVGRLYRLDYSENLSDWTPVDSQTAASTSLILTHSNLPEVPDGKRFYRVATVE